MHQSRVRDLQTLWSSTYHALGFHIMHCPNFHALLWIASPDAHGSFPLPPWPGELYLPLARFSGGRLHTFNGERHVERIFEYRCCRLERFSLAWWGPGRPTWLHLRHFHHVIGLRWISSSIDALGRFGPRYWQEVPNRSNRSSGKWGFGPFWCRRFRRHALKMRDVGLRLHSYNVILLFLQLYQRIQNLYTWKLWWRSFWDHSNSFISTILNV